MSALVARLDEVIVKEIEDLDDGLAGPLLNRDAELGGQSKRRPACMALASGRSGFPRVTASVDDAVCPTVTRRTFCGRWRRSGRGG